MNKNTINSKAYWEKRFLTDWSQKNGPDQSTFFARIAIENLPDWFKRLISERKLTICDWGCAEGDGTDLIASCFGSDLVSGVDISPQAIKTANTKFPEIKFSADNWLTDSTAEAMYDIVFSSNTLEHFEQPYDVLENLIQHSRGFVVLALPYRELERDPEHFYTFIGENIPSIVNKQYFLIHSKVVDTKPITPNYWYGEQIILIYANQSILPSLNLNLSSLNISSELHENHVSNLKNDINNKALEITYLKQSVYEKSLELGEKSLELDEKKIIQEKMGLDSVSQQAKIKKSEHTIKETKKELDHSQKSLTTITDDFNKQTTELLHLTSELRQIKKSRSWRWTQFFRGLNQYPSIKLSSVPKKFGNLTYRFWLLQKRDGIGSALSRTSKYVRFQLASARQNRGSPAHNSLEQIKGSDYNPYFHIQLLKPVKTKVIDKFYENLPKPASASFSIITTLLNEEKSIASFMKSIAEQVWRPDEVIIVDGGSTDKTVELIQSNSRNLGINLKLVESPGCSIAAGRNIAIAKSSHSTIVVVDAGCTFNPFLCCNLVGPLSDYPDANMVGGIYHPTDQAKSAGHFIPEWNTFDWQKFLPSSRNLLIKKELWAATGGYPEFLSKTGEDTLFDISYRHHSDLWVFNKAAAVQWDGPANIQAALQLAKSYGYGDGESGFGDERFYPAFKQSKISPDTPPDENSILSAMTAGYLEGRKQRASKEIAGRNLSGLVVILSGVPMTDSGGGQRGAQLALEFASRNYKVVYANIYPSFESAHKIHFDVDMTLIELYQLEDLDLLQLIRNYDPLLENSLMLLEFPHPDFLPLIHKIKQNARRPKIIYDFIDNWDSTLGWTWYTQETENEIIKESDFLTASAKTLKDELHKRSNRPVTLIPNAFNSALFDPQLRHSKPEDLPSEFDQIILYIGALWGEWFDWELLNSAASALPNSGFILVGNVSNEVKVKAKSKNIVFLGLKAQTELPSYLAFCDKCIIPFKTDSITKYVNPLKVYEYLAMQKTVVTTKMEELEGLSGVVISESEKEFIQNLSLSSQDIQLDSTSDLLASHSWKTRADSLVKLVKVGAHQ